jgi:ABC-2 type transport system ATP-binding protein
MTIQADTSTQTRAGTGDGYQIEARDLVKTYPKGVRALDGLSFAVPAGTVFGLLGPNGAGKSTTVKILTTLAQADSGTATVAGLDVRARAAQVRHAIGVVAQRSGADPMATGRENLLLTGRIQGLRGRALAARTDELLGRFDLAGAADDGLTILLTTHYLEEADRLASRLVIVDRGRIVAAGTPDELKGQLHGDAVHIDLADHTERGRLLAVLEGVPAVREIRMDGNHVSARADEGAAALPAVLAALDDAGVPVRAATVARPSLEDVYLRHAGRRFADADQSPATASTGGAR